MSAWKTVEIEEGGQTMRDGYIATFWYKPRRDRYVVCITHTSDRDILIYEEYTSHRNAMIMCDEINSGRRVPAVNK